MADDNTGSNVVWFLAGIAVGASVALLFAPATGEQTRRKIVKRTQQSRDTVMESARDMAERGKDMYERGRKLADDAAEMFERGRKIVESTASNLKG